MLDKYLRSADELEAQAKSYLAEARNYLDAAEMLNAKAAKCLKQAQWVRDGVLLAQLNGQELSAPEQDPDDFERPMGVK